MYTYIRIYIYICFWVRFLGLLHVLLLFGYVPCFLGVYSYFYVSLLPYPSFFPLEFPRRPMASGVGNGLGFFCFGSCRLACWSWNPVDGKDGSLFKQWEAVGYVLDPHQNLKMMTLHGKENGLFSCISKWSCSGSFFLGWGGSMFQLFFIQNICCIYFLSTRILSTWFPASCEALEATKATGTRLSSYESWTRFPTGGEPAPKWWLIS